MNERRLARLQEQIKQRLAVILQRDLADPKLGLVTISRIELDAEFTVCKAYWSVFAPTALGEAKAKAQSAEVLARARGFCQREVGKGLDTRTVPHLVFVYDQGIGGGVRMNQLLKELQDERELRQPVEPAVEPQPVEPQSGEPEEPPTAEPGKTPPASE